MRNESELAQLLQVGKKAYLVGIGGVGMSGLARVLMGRGLRVSGSDLKRSTTVSLLEKEQIQVEVGHRGELSGSPDFLIISSAISETNQDLVSARALGIPVFHRAEVLAFLTNQAISIAVTGAHGKTTSAALASFLLTEAGLYPTCVVGGEVVNYGSNVILGKHHFFVAEVDESDRSHLFFSPDLALITGLDAEHLNTYKDMAGLIRSFVLFVRQVQKLGRVVYCADDPRIAGVIRKFGAKAVSYGLTLSADFSAADIRYDGFHSCYRLQECGKKTGEVELSIPGRHNVVNSLGVIALLRTFGLPYEVFLHLLPRFHGVRRRLEVKLARPEVLVIDDYAHHPTEVRASLSAIEGLRETLTVVFQPHRYSRTAQLAGAFSDAFHDADRLVLTDIYGAGEENREQVSVEVIYEAVKKSGHANVRVIRRDEIIEFLASQMGENETVAFLGAGDIGDIADEFTGRLESTYSDGCRA
ncbi:MAG: UDP-N-acetylmuramate--L-alanine ligase [Omnitrophica bacterium RIFCSPLOWO2_12_FULL_50_11]|nr:MAG: UDP-N-acetylmuramate--L-alanine ligase [Omnitrophica bacterium RIFCSPLOWO2_12_FULL_50_11]